MTSYFVGARCAGRLPPCCSPGEATGACSWTATVSERHDLHALRLSPRCGDPDRWGLLDRTRRDQLPSRARNMVFDVGPFPLVRRVPTSTAPRGFCPRRTVLDKLLAERRRERGRAARGFHRREPPLGRRPRRRLGAGSATGAVESGAVVIGADGVTRSSRSGRRREYDAKPPLATYYYSTQRLRGEDVEHTSETTTQLRVPHPRWPDARRAVADARFQKCDRHLRATARRSTRHP